MEHSDYFNRMRETNDLVNSHPLFTVYAFIMASNNHLFEIGNRFLDDFNFSNLYDKAMKLDKENQLLFRYAFTFISPTFYDTPIQDLGLVDSVNLSHNGRLILLAAMKLYFYTCDATNALDDDSMMLTGETKSEKSNLS